ncbi:Ig-like domain-containing protein [Pseudobutyrivibrio xylanivorans]|uniref:Ig-like domain (Group 2) n=1 Tax=Pseudobutyrivibrio xylanivorans DSM 14809 TaxID=1123012 RepID=A0A1M6D4A8_PSEXY|nr:Ig-like domain-containing protein [Pseudobutyrivibrio xylanivorans]SHI68049.1 Ig-like domain (group 2) [Pseudobutyrivibrio xylanivorans DSM 14809]
MRENLNAIKRLVAFTLTVLLLGTTIWNDVFVIATEENHCSEYVDEQTYAANILQPVGEGDGYCDHCGQVEQAHVHVEEEPVVEEDAAVEDAAVEEVQPAEELPAEEPVEDTSVPEEPQPEIDSTEEAVPVNDEEIVPEDTPVIDEETPEENIENPEEEIVEEEECEHEWTYTSNGDGTHVKKCSKCDEESTEDCVFGEDGKCIHCGYEKEEECEHEWEYISNNDGTHIKRCKKCGEEVTETCQLDENGICHDCLYEDERLMYQEFSKTIHGVKVTVAGDMPRGAKATIFSNPLDRANRIVNESLEEGTFTAFEVFDIDIYRRGGEKYQPDEDGNTVNVSFAGISELRDVNPEEEIQVYRIEDDNTVTEIENDVVGEEVYFDAEHFSRYVAGTYESQNWVYLDESFATIQTARNNIYTKVLKAKFDVNVTDASQDLIFDAYVYKNLTKDNDPTYGGIKVAESRNVTITPDGTGKGYVEIDLSNTTNGYIAEGEKYSIIVECQNDLVQVGYGNVHEQTNTYDAPTFVTNSDGKWEASDYDEIFYIVPGDTIQLTDKTDDSYEIDSITAATGKADGDGDFHYSKGDTDKLTAIIKDAAGNTVDRAVTWSVSPSDNSIVKIDENGNIEAIAAGEATVTATYTNSTKTVTKSVKVFVVSFTLAGWDPDAPVDPQTNVKPTWTYKGSAITPAVLVYEASGSTMPSDQLTTVYANNEDASTSTNKASVTISFTVSGVTYTFVRSFTIDKAPITGDYFTSATLDPATGKISGISTVNGLKPVQDKDFMVDVSSPTASSTGMTYQVDIIAKEINYTGTYTWTKTITGIDVSKVLTAKLTSQGVNLKEKQFDGKKVDLTTDEVTGAWKEVAFYNNDGLQVYDIIKPGNATYVITDKDGTTESPISAGSKTITFTMEPNKGYVGSISIDFTIRQRNMNSTTIKWKHGGVTDNSSFDHTGSPIEVVPGTDFDVYYGDIRLIPYDDTKSEAENKDADYKMSYVGDRTKISDTPMIRVTAVTDGNYTSYNQSSFEIVPCYENDLMVIIDDGIEHIGTKANGYVTGYNEYYNPNQTSKYFDPSDTQHYSPTENSPYIRVVLDGVTDFTLGEDYKIEVFDDKNLSIKLTNSVENGTTKYIKVSALDDGKYAGKKPVVATYIVDKTPLSTLNITYKNNVRRTFTGKDQFITYNTSGADLVIKQGTYELVKGTDYDINYKNNINAGTATFEIVGMNNYTGTLSSDKYKFTIEKASLAKNNADGVVVGLDETTTYPYNGKVYKPKVKVSIVKNNVTTFEEKLDPKNNTSLTTNNYSVTYEEDPSPGVKKVTFTATSNGNFKDAIVAELYTVGNNTSGYKIYVTGVNGSTEAKAMPSGHEVTDESSGVITRYYYLDSNFITYYSGSTQSCAIKVIDSEGNELTKNTHYKSYYNPTTSVNAYTGDTTTYNTTDSPFIQITGRGSYSKNNAVVYFNIQPASIENANITYKDDLDYDESATDAPVPDFTVMIGTKKLEKGVNYTVTSKNYDETTETESAGDKSAGKKHAIITGTGNYTGTVIREYTVGLNIADATVELKNPYDEDDTTYLKTSASGMSVRWENGNAPIIYLKWKNGAVVETYNGKTDIASAVSSSNSLTYTPVASITADGMGLYDARAPKNKVEEYNVITLSIMHKEGTSTQFYGSKDVVYTIKAVNINHNNSEPYKVTYSGQMYKDYTGADIEADIGGKYNYGKQDGDKYVLTENDFYLEPEAIPSTVGANSTQNLKVYGYGNFYGEDVATYHIDQGKVKAYRIVGADKKALGISDENGATYDLTDATKDYKVTYTYTGESQYPEIVLTAEKSETTELIEGTDYEIKYEDDTKHTDDRVSPGPKTITVTVKNSTSSNYKAQVITIKYEIVSKELKNYDAVLSDVPYNAISAADGGISPTLIQTYIANKTCTLKVSSSTESLEYGEDYVIVTDASELAAIQAQDSTETSIKGENLIPSYMYQDDENGVKKAVNWIYIKGREPFSGYKKVPFTIQLNLNSNMAFVSIKKASYKLNADGTPSEAIEPVIYYRAPGGADGSYDRDNPLESSFNLNGTTVYNYTVERSRDGKPGPDENITIKGQYVCKNTKTKCKYYTDITKTGSVVYFLVDLKTYTKINMTSAKVRDYTGRAITATFSGLDGATMVANSDTSTDAQSGDYRIAYTTDYDSYNTTADAINVGAWYAVIVPTEGSKYFVYGEDANHTSGNRYSFTIKYNLSTAKMVFKEGTKEITSTGYTGAEINVPAVITIPGSGNGTDPDTDTIIYTYSDLSKPYVTLNPNKVKMMQTYSIVAEANSDTTEGQNYVYGSIQRNFTITGISLKSDNVTVTATPSSTVYTGERITATVKVEVDGLPDLKEGTDYTVSYKNNINASTDTQKMQVIVTGINAYSDSVTKEFTISPKPITADMITVEPCNYLGENYDDDDGRIYLYPKVTVLNGTTELMEGVDYEELDSGSYANNQSIATSVFNSQIPNESDWTYPQVTVTAKEGGNYTGSAIKTFIIDKLDLTNINEVSISPKSVEYTGEFIDPYEIIKLKVKANGKTATLEPYDQSTQLGDYTIAVLNSAGKATQIKAMGTYNVVITGTNSCDSDKAVTIDFTVNKRSLADNYHYYFQEGEEQGYWHYDKNLFGTGKPGFITNGGLTGDSLKIKIADVTSVTENADNRPDEADIIIVDEEVDDPDNDDSTVKYQLVEGKDYKISVTNAKKAGTGDWNRAATADKHAKVADTSPAITITGMGDYTDSITLPFNIGKNINTLGLTIKYYVPNADLQDSNDWYTYQDTKENDVAWHYTYNGEPQIPDVSVYNGTSPISLKNYTITYTNGNSEEDESIDAGYKYVVITGTGDYCGIIKQKYAINRKALLDTGGPYTNEDPMETAKKQLSFEIVSTDVTKLTDANIQTYLVDEGIIKNSSDPKKTAFKNMYYAIYNGNDIKPSVRVTDHTLGGNGKTSYEIKASDLDIEYKRSNEVAKFSYNSDGMITNPEFAEIHVTFKTPTNSTTPEESFGEGNYYVGAGGSNEFVIQYMIIKHNIVNDFSIQVLNGLNDDRTSFDEGKQKILDILVTNGNGIDLVEGTDYTVSYKDDDGKLTNVLPGKATLRVKGIGNYTGEKTKDFYIDADLSLTTPYYDNGSGVLVPGIPLQTEPGAPITRGNPEIKLVLTRRGYMTEDLVLTYGNQYNIVDTPETDDDFTTNGKVTYSGIQSKYWTGKKEIEYSIKFTPSAVKIMNLQSSYEYTGYPIIPKLELTVSTADFDESDAKFYRDDDKTKETTDFTTPGKITIDLPYSIGGRSYTLSESYEIIKRSLTSCKVVVSQEQRYTGRVVKPAFTIYVDSKNLETGKSQIYTIPKSEYTPDYGEYKTGTACKLKIDANSNSEFFRNTTYATYNIVLSEVANLRVDKKTGTELTVEWDNDLYADGAELKLEKLDSTGKYVEIELSAAGNQYYPYVRVPKSTGSSYVLAGLDSSTQYRVSARSYSSALASSNWQTIITNTQVKAESINVECYSPGTATIEFSDPGSVTLYYIYRCNTNASIDDDPGKLVAIIPASTGRYTNSGLSSGTYYYYVIGKYLHNATLTEVGRSSKEKVVVE